MGLRSSLGQWSGSKLWGKKKNLLVVDSEVTPIVALLRAIASLLSVAVCVKLDSSVRH